MATFVNDTFTDTAGVVLASHTGETGATWAAVTGRGISLIISDANRVRLNAAGQNNLVYASGSPAGAEVTIECDFNVQTLVTTDFVGLGARMATGTETLYLIQYTVSTAVWTMLKATAGSYTQIGSTAAQTLVAGQTYRVVFECLDATKTLFVDGVQIMQQTDNTITASGKSGIRFVNTTAGSNTTSIHIDNYTSYDGARVAPAGGGGGKNMMMMGVG